MTHPETTDARRPWPKVLRRWRDRARRRAAAPCATWARKCRRRRGGWCANNPGAICRCRPPPRGCGRRCVRRRRPRRGGHARKPRRTRDHKPAPSAHTPWRWSPGRALRATNRSWPYLLFAHPLLPSSSAARGRRHHHSRVGFAISAGGHFLDMPDELTRAVFPGAVERERATRRARNSKRLDTGHAQVFVQNSDRIAAHDVLRPRDREGGDRNAAGQRFELHHAERVGAAREHEDIGRREMRGQGAILQQSEELRVRKAPLQRRLLWAGADDDLRAGKIEREERFEVLFDREPPYADEDGARKAEFDRAIRPEQIGVHAARPHPEVGKSSLTQFGHERWRRYHRHGCGGMKSP